jgi:DNA invertase Pin-like site-specific DNA recombinase
MDTSAAGGYPLREHLRTLQRFAVKAPSAQTAIAYSYLRFSSQQQSDGDSIRRQTALRDAWLKRNPNIKLDTTLTDAGVSGFTGTHRKNRKHALAAFLDLVERGRVPSGSRFIVENLDRLTRETPVDAIPAVLGLIKAGITVVQLAPTEVEYSAQMDQGRLMMMLWELSRGNSESVRKQQLVGDSWKARKEAARAAHTPFGRMCPAWLELDGDKYRAKADAAKAVRRVFELCADGLGTMKILARLRKERVAPIGRSGDWERSYVKKLLHSVAVLGTYQPYSGTSGLDRKPDGEAVEGFFPRVVSAALWHKAHEAMKNRTRRSGRPTKRRANPFSGLLRCAVDQCPLHVSGSRGVNRLVNASALQKVEGAKWRSFPQDVFTTAVLGKLSELKAAELFTDPGAARLTELQTQLSDVERLLTSATARFEGDPESQEWQKLVSKYDKQKRGIVRELADERQRCANPLSASWVEAVDLMARDEPERLRAALMSVVEGVWCVFVGGKESKVAAVQVHFRGGGQRSYLISYLPRRRPKGERGAPVTEVKSFADAFGNADLDFRDSRQADRVRQLIETLDPTTFTKPTDTKGRAKK